MQKEEEEDMGTKVAKRIDFIVPKTDDPSTPAFTLRAMVIGTFFGILLSVANSALAFRTNAFVLSASIAVLLSYPLGILWHKILPVHSFVNPGPFSMKEHIIASCSNVPYGMDNVVAQVMPNMMNSGNITFLEALAFVFVTQFLGYGLSGLCRRFLVKPSAMWWPGNLSTIALFVSFHKTPTDINENAIKENGKSDLTVADNFDELDVVSVADETVGLSRFKFFWIAFAAMFAWTWLPEFFFPVLQAVSLLCFLPSSSTQSGVLSKFNAVAASVTNGVGFMGLTFDWQYILSINITSPFWAVLVNSIGAMTFGWILMPLFYSYDVWGMNDVLTKDSLNPIINSPSLFIGNPNNTRYGQRVAPDFFYDRNNSFNLNVEAYETVAPVRITSYFALVYACSFLAITAALSHVILWHGKDIYRQFQNALKQMKDDVDAKDLHNELMEAYPDVPDWAYVVFLVFCTIAAVFVSVFTKFHMPWWAVFFNLLLCVIFVLPFGVIQAISGFQLGLNVLTEFVIGLMIPGQTIAVMAFKSWGTNNVIQALALVQDLKLGQYLHIPPYAMVFAQFYGTLLNAIISTSTSWFMMFDTGDLLNPNQGDWSYTSYQVFYSAGGIWGAIGPQRFFGIGSVYSGLLWCFPVGLLLPVIPWLCNKFYKSRVWIWINFPVFFSVAGPSMGFQNYIVVPLAISYFFQVYVYKKYNEWYKKYNYVMGSAFDGATGTAIILISILALKGFSFTSWNALNPNTENVKLDYYCYPGASYLDYDCHYYTRMNEMSGLVFGDEGYDNRACT